VNIHKKTKQGSVVPPYICMLLLVRRMAGLIDLRMDFIVSVVSQKYLTLNLRINLYEQGGLRYLHSTAKNASSFPMHPAQPLQPPNSDNSNFNSTYTQRHNLSLLLILCCLY
jgi:hypothetical protein